MDILSVVLTVTSILGGILLADFISGILHWAEDRYGEKDWPLVGKAIEEAEGHHRTPMRILTRTFYERNARVMVIAFGFGILFYLTIGLNAFTISTLLFGAFSNEIHACAHRGPDRNSRLIRWIQKTGFFQTHFHHAAHHRCGKDTHYCVMTNYLNPVLERINFWRRFEWLIRNVTGLKTRAEMMEVRLAQSLKPAREKIATQAS